MAICWKTQWYLHCDVSCFVLLELEGGWLVRPTAVALSQQIMDAFVVNLHV
jgi:hypothetical protein